MKTVPIPETHDAGRKHYTEFVRGVTDFRDVRHTIGGTNGTQPTWVSHAADQLSEFGTSHSRNWAYTAVIAVTGGSYVTEKHRLISMIGWNLTCALPERFGGQISVGSISAPRAYITYGDDVDSIWK